MEIFELAKQLGVAIKDSDEGKRAEAARRAYEENEKIAALTTEFEVQQKALASMAGNADADKNLVDAIQERLNEIYDEVLATDVYKTYESARADLDKLVSKVHAVMAAQIGGPGAGCTHDCSTCGGCS